MNVIKCGTTKISLNRLKLSNFEKMTQRGANMAWRPFFDRYNSINKHPMNDLEDDPRSLYNQ